MPEYLSPGVYVEETSYRSKSIQGVSTSTAGFVGRARRGSEGKPTLVTSYAAFTRAFGDPISNPSDPGDHLGHAMRGFFDNGGVRAYIVRVLGDGALAADSASAANVGHGVALRITATVLAAGTSIKLNSLRGVDTNATLEFYSVDTGALVHSSTVVSYDAVRGTVVLTAGPPSTLKAADTFVRVQGIAHTAASYTIQAADRGEEGDNVSVLFTPTDRPPVRLTGTSTTDRATPAIGTMATGAGLAPGAAVPLTLTDATAYRTVRTGDTVTLDNDTDTEDVTITVADQGVDFSAVVNPYPVGSEVFLASDSTGAALATPVLLGLTTNPIAATDAANDLPHAVAALLEAGMQITFVDGATTETVTVDGGWAFANPVVTADALVHDFASAGDDTDLTLSNAGTGRLIVQDITAFAAPQRAGALEPLAVSHAGGTDETAAAYVDTATNTVLVDPTVTTGEWTSVESLQAAAAADDTLAVASTGSFYSGALIELDDGATKLRATVASVDADNRTITLTAPVGVDIDVAATATTRTAYARTVEFTASVLVSGAVAETFDKLSFNDDQNADSWTRNWIEAINDPDTGSRYVSVTWTGGAVTLGLDELPSAQDAQAIVLSGGNDGSAPEDRHLIGEDNGPGQRTGIQALGERGDISMVAVPGVTSEAVQAALITHAELMRYRVAVLDAQQTDADVTEILAHRNNYDSTHAAYYTPWLETMDLATGRTIEVPPSGHMMGIWARSDNTRGVHKAPANEVVRSITGLKYTLTKGEQDVLNPEGVNVIREFEKRGVRVWGARTISSDSEWKYLNVRRLFCFLEHSIDEGTQWVVFEPNNEALWARTTQTISSFLFGVWTTGAMLGTTPDEAFFVRCDRTTMTQDDLDNGRLICNIGIAPTKPAEFVVFRIGQFTASS